MDVQTLIPIFCVMGMGIFIYSLYQIQGRIWCTFRRPNKTKVEKWVPMRSKYVHFDGGRYNIITKRITLLRWKRGIFQLFPIFVPSLDYSWDTPNPHDPGTYKTTWDTPEAREASQQEDAFKAFARGILTQAGGKSRFSELLIPMITIGAVLIVGFLVYQQGQQMQYYGQALDQILTKLGMVP